jgi:hypothetical protein
MFQKIKINFITIIVILICNNYIYSQKGFIAGIMAGATTSQVDGDKLSGYDKAGVQLGIYLLNKPSLHWGFNMEMKFIQKGSRTNTAPPDNVNTQVGRYYKLRLNYIEVPLLINYFIKKKYIIETGLGFAYLIRSREDTDGNGFLEPYVAFKKFDFPFYFGVSYLVSNNFHLNFRYSYSLRPIRNHPENQTWYFDRGQYNNLLSFGMYLNI